MISRDLEILVLVAPLDVPFSLHMSQDWHSPSADPPARNRKEEMVPGVPLVCPTGGTTPSECYQSLTTGNGF